MTCTSSQTIANEDDQPGEERASRIVGLPDCMQRQQNVLHEVLDIGCLQESPPVLHDSPDERSNVAQQLSIGQSTAILSGSHQVGKALVEFRIRVHTGSHRAHPTSIAYNNHIEAGRM